MKILITFFILINCSFAQEETDFDKFVDKQKKEKLEAKPEIVPSKGQNLKNDGLKRKKGLIDPLIDGAKEASDSGKKKSKK